MKMLQKNDGNSNFQALMSVRLLNFADLLNFPNF